MRRVLAALAMTVLPVGAEAVSLNVKNCAAYAITVAVYRPNEWRLDTQSHITAGQSAELSCQADTCWMKVTYMPNSGGVFAEFPNPVGTDRCTRGSDDNGLGELPAAGNCGC